MASKNHPNGYWNYETCYEEAKKYNSRSEFMKGCVAAYGVALKNGWINEYVWFSPSVTEKKWNRETCFEEAKKYTIQSEFQKNAKGAFKVAWKNGWLTDYTWFENGVKIRTEKRRKWNRETCYEEAKKYKSRSEFQKFAYGAYEVALKNGWICEYKWLEDGRKKAGDRNRKWNRETCYEEAKKYKSRSEFMKNSSRAYNVAWKNKWLCDYTWFAPSQSAKKWTYETCYEEAKKHKSLTEFQKNSRRAYTVAWKNKWLCDYTWFETKQKPSGYWTYERCYDEAKKYKTRTEFKNCSSAAYSVSYQNKWIKDYTWIKYVQVPSEYKYNLLEEFISEYEFRTFLENNDQNILLIIIRNLEPKYEPIKKDLEKALAHTKETDPIKALRDKYMSDDEEQDVNDETENNGEENVHDITTIDMDDDEAFKAVMTEITESSEESEKEDGEKEEKELSIDDVVKNDETELKVINKIEHMLTPEDRQYIMEKFLNDKRRQWMAEREKKSCNA